MHRNHRAFARLGTRYGGWGKHVMCFGRCTPYLSQSTALWLSAFFDDEDVVATPYLSRCTALLLSTFFDDKDVVATSYLLQGTVLWLGAFFDDEGVVVAPAVVFCGFPFDFSINKSIL